LSRVRGSSDNVAETQRAPTQIGIAADSGAFAKQGRLVPNFPQYSGLSELADPSGTQAAATSQGGIQPVDRILAIVFAPCHSFALDSAM